MYIEKKINYFFVFGLILTLLPFLVLATYAHPQADDDFMNCNYHDTMGFLGAMKHWYLGWTGRYAGVALQLLNPWCFQTLLFYKLMIAFVLLLYPLSFYYVVYTFWNKQTSFQEKLLISISLTSLYFFVLSTPQIFYWAAGTLNYQLALPLFTISLTLFYKILYKNVSIIAYVMLFLLIVITNGLIEPIAIMFTLVLTVMGLYYYFHPQKCSFAVPSFFIIWAIFWLGVSIFSIGNQVRHGYEVQQHHYSLFQILWYATYDTARFIKHMLSNYPLLPMAILLLNFFIQKTNIHTSKNSFYWLIISLLLWGGGLIISSFLFMYGKGLLTTPERMLNMTSFIFIVGGVYHLWVLSQYLKSAPPLPQYVKVMLILFVGFMYFRNDNMFYAYKDLLSGKAHNYDKQLKQRYELIQQANTDTVYVSCLKDLPHTIYYKDITGWLAVPYGKYYGKESVKLIFDDK